MATMNQSSRTYAIEFGGAMIAYAIVLIISINLIHRLSGALVRDILALAPVVPLAFALWAFVRFYHRIDELQRRIQLDALALSFGGTILITISYGFLQNVGFPMLSWVWITPLMIALWGLGAALASMRYQ